MSSVWHKVLEPDVLALVLIFGGGAITGIVTMIVYAWRNNRESERLAILKQQMIEKGMSADDIVRVVQAGAVKEEE